MGFLCCLMQPLCAVRHSAAAWAPAPGKRCPLRRCTCLLYTSRNESVLKVTLSSSPFLISFIISHIASSVHSPSCASFLDVYKRQSRGRLSYLTPDRTKPITARKLGDDFDKAAVLALSLIHI